MAQASQIVVNLTSVYEAADLSSQVIYALPTIEIRNAGLDVARIATALRQSVPSSREKIEIPGCRGGEFCTKLQPGELCEDGEDGYYEPGNFGLFWSEVNDLEDFTARNWCIVVNAYMDE